MMAAAEPEPGGRRQHAPMGRTHQSAVSITMDAALMDKNILSDRTALGRGNKSVPLLV